jgi:hypothetical protein
MWLFVPGVGEGHDLASLPGHDPRIRRWVEAWTRPVVMEPVLIRVDLADVRDVAGPSDRGHGRDVVERRVPDQEAGQELRWHPSMLASQRCN